MQTFDYEAISAEFVRALRGNQSQRALSRRLGFRSNVVYHWEASRRHPTMLQTFEMLRLIDSPRHGARQIEHIDDLDKLARYLKTFSFDLGPTEIADLIDRNRHTVSRWLRGDSQPKLPEFLEFVEATRRRALDWLSGFVDPGELPSTADAWKRLDQVRALGAMMPMSMAVINVVELDDYKQLPEHQPGWIARRLGIDQDTENYMLTALEDVGIMAMGATHWEVQVEFISLLQGPVDFWVRRCLEDPYDWRFFVAAVSSQTRDEIHTLTRQYWRDVGEIFAREDGEMNQVIAMTVLATRIDRSLPDHDN